MPVNLLTNPRAEDSLTGWTLLEGTPQIQAYGTSGGWPSASDPGPPGSERGSYFFYGGEVARSRMNQVISLPLQTEIDAGMARFDFGGWLGGWSSQDDGARLSAEFLDASGQPLGVSVLGPVTAGERGDATGLLRRSAGGIVPPGSRTARVLLLFTRAGGTSNDGYADELWLTLSVEGNLVSNPGAEDGLAGWTVLEGSPAAQAYGASGGWPTPADPGPPDRGNNFWYGGEVSRSRMAQQVTLPYPAEIDARNAGYDFSAWLGGWQSQDDRAQVSVQWRSASGETLGTVTLGPVYAADRNHTTGLIEQTTSGGVPVGARTGYVEVLFTRSGGTANDGYADAINLSLNPGGL